MLPPGLTEASAVVAGVLSTANSALFGLVIFRSGRYVQMLEGMTEVIKEVNLYNQERQKWISMIQRNAEDIQRLSSMLEDQVPSMLGVKLRSELDEIRQSLLFLREQLESRLHDK